MAWTYTSNTYEGRYLQLSITESLDAFSNSSILNWTLTSTGGSSTYYSIGETTVTINGEQVYHKDLTHWDERVFPAAKGSVSGSLKIVHNADGTKLGIPVSFKTRVYQYEPLEYAGDTIDLTPIETYTLSINEGTGSSISVWRTSSGYADTGKISAGTRLYYGDKLKITFTQDANYRLLTTTVNSIAFTSGNTHTVTENVFVVSTAQVLASAVGATDANIGSISTITVTKYNSGYCHSLQYSFGDLNGYITSSGGVQSTEVKFSGTSVAFSVPATFYSQIPNAKTGICTIICRTYEKSSNQTILGNVTTCTFTVTAAYANCAPALSVSVVDTNEVTKALTGNSNMLIRYKSTAECTVKATSMQSSTIDMVSIADTTVIGTTSGATTTATKSFPNTDKTSFNFSATDSRGYTVTKTLSPTMVAYVKLTCNPEITRPTPTGSTMLMTFSGNVYRGSFGAYSNTLTIKYRYKAEGGSYSSWQTIDPTNIIFGTSSYRSSTAITLQDEFDYHKSYEFQIQAEDGASGYVLSTATATVPVQRGVPIFDWGENDFNINVALMLSNVNILDIMYPVGAVYMHSSSVLPTAVANVGMWESVTTGISKVYAWKRTA